jgi:phosphinothricin acetyltransferase
VTIRPAEPGDAAAVAAIYGHHVVHGFGTFEETPPSAAEIVGRISQVTGRGLPYLVAEAEAKLIGFAYAAPFRERAAYRYLVEDSVYIHPDHLGQGVGKALVGELIAACERLGLRQMVAVIGDSANAGSIGLHRSLGFEHAGTGRAFGFKQGRWVDIVWMQRPLNGGADSPPEGPGLDLGGH